MRVVEGNPDDLLNQWPLLLDTDSIRSVGVAWIFKENGAWCFKPRITPDRSLFYNAVFFIRYATVPTVFFVQALLTLAHSLVAAPFDVAVHLVCVTGEHNYSTGDVLASNVSFVNDAATGSNGGCAVYFDATNVYVRFGSTAGDIFGSQNKTTGAGITLTNANWKVRVKAWV